MTPVDINVKIENKCNLKCNLITNYPNDRFSGKTQIDNFNNIISNKIIPPTNAIDNYSIKYNNNQEILSEIHILKPSLHTYGGNPIDAELILKHEKTIICIPIIERSFNGTIDKLINEEEINFNDLIPNRPFYTYKGSIDSANSIDSEEYNIIVFKKMHPLIISTKKFNGLNKHDGTYNFNIEGSTNKISINESGPILGDTDVNYPITCEPYDDPYSTETIPEDKTSSGETLGQLFNKAIVQMLLGMIILVILYKGFFWVSKKMSTRGSQNGGVGNIVTN
tara:strand:- start:2013 stop:2852 length:840 start_codon:yes stop_codon:yes gene_type:complete